MIDLMNIIIYQTLFAVTNIESVYTELLLNFENKLFL